MHACNPVRQRLTAELLSVSRGQTRNKVAPHRAPARLVLPTVASGVAGTGGARACALAVAAALGQADVAGPDAPRGARARRALPRGSKTQGSDQQTILQVAAVQQL